MEYQARENQVKLAEELLGVRFPAAYRASLLRESIGSLRSEESLWKAFTLPGDAERGKGGRTSDDLITGNEDAREWHHFPAGAIAIAGNDCGDFLVLLPPGGDTDELAERVYYWWHATGELFPLCGTAAGIAVIDERSIWNSTHNSVGPRIKNKELLQEYHVAITEHILKIKLPSIYRELLFSDRYGDHYELWNLYPELKAYKSEAEQDEDKDEGLELIYFIEKMTADALERWEEFPEDGLVIAEDGFGDVLLLMQRGLNSEGVMEFEERIYILDHSDSELYILADTLEEFREYHNLEQEA